MAEHGVIDRKIFGAVLDGEKELVGDAERQAVRGGELGGKRRREADGVGRQNIARHGDDHRAGAQHAAAGRDRDVGAAMVDRLDDGAETDRQLRGIGGDERAVARQHAPVDAAIGVARVIEDRQPVELDAIDPAADRVE